MKILWGKGNISSSPMFVVFSYSISHQIQKKVLHCLFIFCTIPCERLSGACLVSIGRSRVCRTQASTFDSRPAIASVLAFGSKKHKSLFQK